MMRRVPTTTVIGYIDRFNQKTVLLAHMLAVQAAFTSTQFVHNNITQSDNVRCKVHHFRMLAALKADWTSLVPRLSWT